MSTLTATTQLNDFINYLDYFSIDSFYQYSKQIEADLSGSFTYKKISTSQMVVGSSGDIVVVDGTGLAIPVGSLLNGSDTNLSWSNIGGTIQEVQIYQGGSLQGSSVIGGSLLLDATLSANQYSVSYGGNQLILGGSNFPTDVGSLGALLHGSYSGANFNISSITLENSQETISLSLSASAYTLTAGDYKAVVSGTGLPTSFSESFINSLLNNGPASIGGSISNITVTQISTGANVLTESGITAPISLTTLFSGQDQFYTGLLANVGTVQAPSAVVVDLLDRLNILAYQGSLKSISFTDSGTPTLTLHLTDLQLYDTYALAEIPKNYNLVLSGVTAYNLNRDLNEPNLKSFSVADYAGDFNYSGGIGVLESSAQSGLLTGITLLDGGVPTLTVAAGEVSSDAAVFNLIKGDFALSIAPSYSLATQTITGLAGHGNTVNLGYLGNFTVTPAGNGTGLTVADAYNTFKISNVNAVEINYQTDIVAATPGSSTVTTGNITELYGAVFGREPDVPGLAYYQGVLQANPSMPLTTFAQWFLASPEYVNNTAHNYAQSATGEGQFITDIYNNLLHRSPENGAIPYYQAIINQFTNGLIPGSAAYAAADALAHAVVLVDFSASAEFLGNVQITAAHPASNQHWLYLI